MSLDSRSLIGVMDRLRGNDKEEAAKNPHSGEGDFVTIDKMTHTAVLSFRA